MSSSLDDGKANESTGVDAASAFHAIGEPVVRNPDESWRVTTRARLGPVSMYRLWGTMMWSEDGS